MIIGGLQKFSLLDYPDHLAAIVFTQGCNFRCHFCYNPMLVRPAKVGKINNSLSPDKAGGEIEEGATLVSEDAFFDFLEARAGKLDAVVLSGGEPTLHSDLPEFAARIRAKGFKVKLDTNGSRPEIIKRLIEGKVLDYIAMDIKSALAGYEAAAGVDPGAENIRSSIGLIMNSGLPYEFRTTVVPGLTDMDDIRSIGELLKGADKWYVQRFKSDVELLDRDYQGLPAHSEESMKQMADLAATFVKASGLR